jgi:hypothetical protein
MRTLIFLSAAWFSSQIEMVHPAIGATFFAAQPDLLWRAGSVT